MMLFSSAQLARKHNLDSVLLEVSVNNSDIERVECHKLLGIHFTQYLQLGEHVKNTTDSCYATIAVLDYGDTVFYPLTNVDLKRL